jgi:TonB family protein
MLMHRYALSAALLLCSCAQQAPQSPQPPQPPPPAQQPPAQSPQPPQQPESTAARTQAVAPPQVASRPLGEAASAASINEPAVYADQAAYAAVIRSMVRKNLEVPRNVPDSASALVEVVLSDNGAVTGLRTLTSSGFPAYDAAVRRAIQRAQPYPLLAVPGQEGPLTMRLRFQMKD